MSTLVTGNVITDATITREKLAFDPYISASGFRNKIINGDFRVWQRGLTFSNPSTSFVFCADRWIITRGVPNTSASRSTDVPAGFQYSIKHQRTAGDTSTENSYLIYTFETKDVIPLQNSQITVSVYAKKGANFNSFFGVQLVQSTTIDQPWNNISTNNTAVNTKGFSITDSWNRYSTTFTILPNTTQFYFLIYRGAAGTAGADDSVYTTGVQLETGNLTDFEFRPYDIELPLCQRYFTTSYRPGYYPTDTPVYGNHIDCGNPNILSPRNGTLNVLPCQIRFPVQMRRLPTVTIYRPTTGGAGYVESTNQDEPIAVSSVIASQNNIGLVALASTPTVGRAFQFQYTANAELDI